MISKKLFFYFLLVLINSYLFSKNYLVVIAIDIYQNRLSLAGKVDKAEELKNILYSKYEIDNIIGLYDYDATKKNIEALFNKLQAELNANDSLIFYYSGHGYINDESKEYFWIPSDAGINESEKINWIPCSDVVNFFKNCNASQNLLVVDSIFPEDFIDEIDTSSLNTSNSEPLQKKNVKKTKQVLSSGVKETGKNSNEFTENIIEYLKSNKAPDLTVSNLFKNIKEKSPSNSYVFGNIKDANYDENSVFILSARTKPIEPVKNEEQVKKEEPKKDGSVKSAEKNIQASLMSNSNIFNKYNIAGIILLPFSTTILTSGIFIFIFDLTGINSQIQSRLSDPNYTYDQYLKDYTLNLALFCSGIGLMAFGTAMMIFAAIPLTVYKGKKTNLSFNIDIDSGINLNFKYDF